MLCKILLFLIFSIQIVSSNILGLHQNDSNLHAFIVREMDSASSYLKYNISNIVKKGKKINQYKNPDFFGEFGQGQVVDQLFKLKDKGFFIEVGAFDGEEWSNTLGLELFRFWSGILIEPNPDSYGQLLLKNRRVSSINTCLSTSKYVQKVDFDLVGPSSGIIINGTIKPGEAIHQKRLEIIAEFPEYQPKYSYDRRTITINCIPLTAIILAYGNPTIDYLSLDVEGAEFAVLQTIDFDSVNILVISVNVQNLARYFPGNLDDLTNYMVAQGYYLYLTHKQDCIFIQSKRFFRELNKEL